MTKQPRVVPLKWLTLMDEYTRECLVLHAVGTLTGADVRRIIGQVIGHRRAPTRFRSDNGSAFLYAALVDWLPGVGPKLIGAAQKFGAILEHPQSATGAVVDPAVSF
jgi:transposase InsO family protein